MNYVTYINNTGIFTFSEKRTPVGPPRDEAVIHADDINRRMNALAHALSQYVHYRQRRSNRGKGVRDRE